MTQLITKLSIASLIAVTLASSIAAYAQALSRVDSWPDHLPMKSSFGQQVLDQNSTVPIPSERRLNLPTFNQNQTSMEGL